MKHSLMQIFLIVLSVAVTFHTLLSQEIENSQEKEIQQWIEALKSDDWEVREEAQKRLIMKGNLALIPLKEALKQTEDFDLRLRIYKILNTPVLYLPADVVQKIPDIAERLISPDISARRAAVQSILNLERLDCLDFMKTVLNDRNKLISLLGAQGLAAYGDEEGIKILLEALKDNETISEAARCLGCAKVESAIPLLIQSLTNPRAFEAVSFALIRMSETALLQLIDALNTDNLSAKLSIARTLGDIPDIKSVDKLIHLLSDLNDDVAGVAAQSLSRIGGDKVVSALREVAKSSSRPFVRDAAERALAELNDRGNSPYLLQQAIQDSQSSNETTRSNAAWIIGQVGTEKEVPVLKRLFEDKSDSVKYHAVVSAIWLGDGEAVSIIKEMLREKESYFSGSAVTTCQFEGWITISANQQGRAHTINDASVALSCSGHRVGLYGLVRTLEYENVYWGSQNVKIIRNLLATDFNWKKTDSLAKRRECAEKAIQWLDENIDYLYWQKDLRKYRVDEEAKKKRTPVDEKRCTFLSVEQMEKWRKELEEWRQLLKFDEKGNEKREEKTIDGK